MDEELLAADDDFLEDVDFAQLLEIARGRLAARNFLLDDVLDAAVRQFEYQVDQLTAVDLGRGLLDVLDRHRLQRAYGCDLFGRPGGSFLDALQHVENPRLPRMRAGNVQQQPVVVRLVGDDVSAEVEDGQRQQPFLDQEEAVEHAPGAAIAIGKRVN